MPKNRRRQILTLLIMILICLAALELPGHTAPGKVVWVVPVTGPIDVGLVKFLQRTYKEAEQLGVDHILMEIDTPGGFLNAAVDISSLMRKAEIPTAAFVTGGAISAGTLIALTAEKLVMMPGTTMGAAEPQLMGMQRADEKTLSYWVGQLQAAASANGRDPKIAAAMADTDIEIPGLIAAGKLLTLTDTKALEHKMIDEVLSTRQEVLKFLGLEGARVVVLKPSPAETLARWITGPYVGPILLTLGFAGLIMELYSPGLGFPGIIGLISFAVYFAGHIAAGLAGWESLVLFLLGILLLAVEIFVTPGLGFAGVLGLGALLTSVFITAPTTHQAIVSIVIALISTIVLLAFSIKYLPTRRVWSRLILSLRQENQAGYIAPESNLVGYVGRKGIAVTPLRPAGTMELESGERLDVVAEGSFIPADTKVQVDKVEGIRIIVRKSRD
ncbi:MAG: nodulation protein NfeD [Syntrophomonadaceae bacterium]|nr:nodulation protein NfeD [Syntrophomonadaceae bacterium]